MPELDTCCEAMEQILEEFDGPFHTPIRWSMETAELSRGPLAIWLFNLTPSGKSISRKGRKTLYLSFCPICGAKLEEVTSDESTDL